MKHIKNFNLFEMAMGVPEGNTELAKRIYQRIVDLYEYELNDLIDKKTLNFSMYDDFRISDYEINKISIEINLQYSTILEKGEVQLISMAFKDALGITKTNKEYYTKRFNQSTVNLIINLGISVDGTEASDLNRFLTNKKNKLTSSIAHELKHAYDSYKKPINKLVNRSEYSTFTKLCFGIKAIDKFFFNLYYTSVIENLVKPSELAASISVGDINKENFLNFLKSDRTYSNLKTMQSYTYEKFRADLLADVSKIRSTLEIFDIEVPEKDNDVVDLILKLAYNNLKNEKMKSLYSIIDKLTSDDDFLGSILNGSKTQEEKYLDKYLSKISYENYEDFFVYEIKKFIFVSSNMLRKLSKLYDMAKDVKVNPLHAKITAKGLDKEVSTDLNVESIDNIDLWREVNGIKPDIKS